MYQSRHARPCAGHPRLTASMISKDVDGRDKPGHDGAKLTVRCQVLLVEML
ncbi:MAG: hypothetical protein HZA66_16640 [Rhodopseudomonas palustris]|uniref:Uncharacterized protein n=1 Tax=Rhodopseudomonas palustris TaxID=1076 RepID=A0A933S104_RHOPL|nr:hypothetical protein [Rhodopseudomonas palustris]